MWRCMDIGISAKARQMAVESDRQGGQMEVGSGLGT